MSNLFEDLIPGGVADFLPDFLGSEEEEGDDAAPSLNLSNANFLSLGPGGQILGPVNQATGGSTIDNSVANNFTNVVSNIITDNSTNISGSFNTDNSDNSVRNNINVDNSVRSELVNNIQDSFNSTNISNRLSTTNVSNIADSTFIEDSNLLGTFTDIVNVAAQGGASSNFADANDESNLIELRPEDAQQAGGLRGLGGNDQILGTSGRDVANGNQGDDSLVGGGGEDFLRGGQSADVVDGGADADIVNGNRGDDIVRGGAGDDVVRGGADNDYLYGNEGNDVLTGDRGYDVCYGGGGSDDFILNPSVDRTENAGQADWIADFNVADGDRIGLAGVENIEQISAGDVDVNQDGISDTALIGSNNEVLGVALGINASEFNVQDSVFVVGAQDSTINTIG
jgi:Ca2+-binding RTX toxin-like protein